MNITRAENPSQVRPMVNKDLEQILEWRNHESIRRFMYTQHEISLEEHRNWFERASQDKNHHLLVFEIQGKSLGFVNIHEISKGGIADWGFYVAPDAPKGTGSQLGCAVLEYAFHTHKFHKLVGQVLAYNESSINFHEKLGFQQEGILREQYFDGQIYHHIICFGLLATEWQKNF